MLRRQFRLARIIVCAVLMTPLLVMIGVNRDDVVQAERLATVLVTISSNGAERQVRTAQSTVGATLKEAGIQLGKLDRVSPGINERPTEGLQVKVVRVYDAVESIKEPIAFETVKTFTSSLRPGQVKVKTEGQRGEKLLRYLVRYEDGKAINRTLLGAQVLTDPVNKVVSIGSASRYVSRGEYRSRKILRMSASAYDPGPRSCGRYATGRTACGLKAGYGVAAVDPDVIPLGTQLYIEGYGYAVAGDTGSAIQGNRIDLGFNTYSEAKGFGRKSVIVHILRE